MMFLYHDTGRNELITSGNDIRKLFPSVFTKLSRQFFLFLIVINTFYCQPCYISRFFPGCFFFLGAFSSRSSGSGASRSQTASASLKNTIVPSTSMKRICSESAIFSLDLPKRFFWKRTICSIISCILSFKACVCLDNSSIMETVETSKNKEKKSDKDGSTRMLCEHASKLPKRTLVLCESDNS